MFCNLLLTSLINPSQFYSPTTGLVEPQSLPSFRTTTMCRLCMVMYYDCGHLHHYHPLNPCEAGFQPGKPGRCLAETKASPNINDEYCLEDRPDCPVCLENEIRDRYAIAQMQLVKEAKSRGLSYAGLKPDIQKMLRRMTEEVSKLKAEKRKSEHDWATGEETTWTEGIREVIWSSDTQEIGAFEQCGDLNSWHPYGDERVESWLDSVEMKGPR